jgi:hypothetical protein
VAWNFARAGPTTPMCAPVGARKESTRRTPKLAHVRKAFVDIAVAVAVGPVAEAAIAQLVEEQGDDAVLRGAFRLAGGAHFRISQCPALVGPTCLMVPADRSFSR